MAIKKRASSSMSFASVKVTITPHDASYPPIFFGADGTYTEEEFLSEPQPNSDRAKLFMGNDGESHQYIDRYAIDGKRDLTIFDSPITDALDRMALANPQPEFDLDFQYQRNYQDDNEIRSYRHEGCKFMNQPGRGMNNSVATKKYTFMYAKLLKLDATGVPVS